MSDIIVSTKAGKIRGIQLQSSFSDSEYYAFYGVPYALPPIGDLRFRDPVKMKPWKSIRDGTTEKGGCSQISLLTFNYLGTEDCLYINIYTPRIPKRGDPLMPVIVCIPLGGLQCGSPDPSHQGSPDFVMHHDVVYVTISHRLHILGFLNLNIPECSGNMGLKDMIMAFEYISENIHYFGGDASNITALGSSSGATMIHALLILPIKPLFHKAVLMGDYVFNNVLKVEEENMSVAFEFARTLGFQGDNPKNLLNFLKKIPDRLLTTQLKVFQSLLERKMCKIFPSGRFLPTIDANSKTCLVPKNAREFIPITKKIPIIYGQCQKEAVLGFTKSLEISTEDHFKASCRQNCWGWMHDLDDNALNEINEKVESFYYGKLGKSKPVPIQIDVISDTAFSEIYDTVIDLIASECPVYVYKFEYQGELGTVHNIASKFLTDIVEGTYHADDYGYWSRLDALIVSNKTPEIIKSFTKIIVNFATTGNPTDSNMEVEWKPHTKENPCYLSINETLKMFDGRLNEERAQFWDKIKEEYRKKKYHEVE